MELPQPLQSGAPINAIAPWSRRIIDYLRAITVRPSATVSVSTTANGTLLSAAPPARTVRAAAAEPALNQFLVSCAPDPDYESGNAQGQEGDPPPAEGHWLVSVLGGTAQAMFGAITNVPDVENRKTAIAKITAAPGGSGGGADPAEAPKRKYCFISAVYKIAEDGEYIHEFAEDLDFTVGETPPQSTVQQSYFPIAVVYDDGTVRQGHLGAIYVASMEDVVDTDDGPGAEEEEEEEEEE